MKYHLEWTGPGAPPKEEPHLDAIAALLDRRVDLPRLIAPRLAMDIIAEYERTVPSDHLQAILSERRVAFNEITPASTLEERAEPRSCHCGTPILPGQAYAVDGPEHIGCRKGT